MDSMYSAIKSRRGGLLNDSEENAHQEPEEKGQPGGLDMKSLVQALSEEQKSQLLSLLVGNDSNEAGSKAGSKEPSDIQKGEMGPGEESEIEESLGPGHESEDQIADSMLASSDKMRSARGDNPRNLGERVRFDLAKKLKAKGK